MKRELNSKNFGFAQHLSRVVEREHPYELLCIVDNSELNRLLSIVFAPDEFGSIQGDLGLLLSDKVDPQIVNFIKNQLLFDTSSKVQSPLPSWLSDEDAEFMRRNPNETMDDYSERLAKKMIELKDSLKQQKVN